MIWYWSVQRWAGDSVDVGWCRGGEGYLLNCKNVDGQWSVNTECKMWYKVTEKRRFKTNVKQKGIKWSHRPFQSGDLISLENMSDLCTVSVLTTWGRINLTRRHWRCCANEWVQSWNISLSHLRCTSLCLPPKCQHLGWSNPWSNKNHNSSTDH